MSETRKHFEKLPAVDRAQIGAEAAEAVGAAQKAATGSARLAAGTSPLIRGSVAVAKPLGAALLAAEAGANFGKGWGRAIEEQSGRLGELPANRASSYGKAAVEALANPLTTIAHAGRDLGELGGYQREEERRNLTQGGSPVPKPRPASFYSPVVASPRPAPLPAPAKRRPVSFDPTR